MVQRKDFFFAILQNKVNMNLDKKPHSTFYSIILDVLVGV